MKHVKLRFIKPTDSECIKLNIDDLKVAVNYAMRDNLKNCLSVELQNEVAYYAIVETEDDDQFVGRHFTRGIARRGGLIRENEQRCSSIKQVEVKLSLPPGFLSEPDWEHEETLEQAWQRTIG